MVDSFFERDEDGDLYSFLEANRSIKNIMDKLGLDYYLGNIINKRKSYEKLDKQGKNEVNTFLFINYNVINNITEKDLSKISKSYKEDYKSIRTVLDHFVDIDIFDLAEFFIEDYDKEKHCLLKPIIDYFFETGEEKIYSDLFVDFSSYGLSSQKFSSFLKKLEDNSILLRRIDNNKPYFKINQDFKNDLILCHKMKLIKKYPYEFPIRNLIVYGNENTVIEDKNTNALKLSKENLLNYLKNIVSLESDIYSLDKRYISVLEDRKKAQDKLAKECISVCKKVYKEKNSIEKRIKELNSLINDKPVLNNQVKLDLPDKPQKPIFDEKKPQKPEFQKSGLFNKKKVELENNLLLSEYNSSLELYNIKYSEYLEKCKEYEYLMKKYKEECLEISKKEKELNEEKYNEDLKEFKNKKEEYERELKEQEKLLDYYNDNSSEVLDKALSNLKSYNTIKSTEYELDYIKECIIKNIELKNQLYSYNVIYGKYRNFVAICSFIDYFESGRCETLDGSNGAYNLYEQELRTNMIIDKLDQIVDSLETVKENQYYIYSELQRVNQSLDIINSQLLVSNYLQTVSISKLNTIVNNTNQIAYNSEVMAFYSKKNANYTKAMLFMNIMDRL